MRSRHAMDFRSRSRGLTIFRYVLFVLDFSGSGSDLFSLAARRPPQGGSAVTARVFAQRMTHTPNRHRSQDIQHQHPHSHRI